MKRNLLVFSAILGLAAATSACTETADLVEVIKPVPADSTANFPAGKVKVDTTLFLKVYYQPSNGCGRFAMRDSSTVPEPNKPNTTITTIKIYAAYPEEGQDVVCTAQARRSIYTINFKPTTVGKHVFRFWKSDTEVVADTVEVIAR
ncbi:hypothetical protein [Nibribacter koreensis]|uniref:Lipoprotein n=1 Tax=Nibribacter koreensis TaxID=1084519 RepID=A0ABP8F6Z6_9BACT